MKSIAFIHRSPFPNGGAEKVTIDIASWLIERGWRIYVIVKTIDERLPEWIKNSDRISIIPYNSLSHKQLARFIVELSHLHRFDAIAIQGLWLRRIDIIREQQSAPIIYCNHGVPLWQAIKKIRLCGLVRSRTAKLPILGHAIGWLSYRASDFFRYRTINIYKMIYKNCDVMTQLCDAYTHAMAKVLEVSDDNHLVTMYNAQPPAPIDYTTEKRREVIYVGRLSYEDKRVDRLLDIWHRVERRFPDWRLRIVGEGRERANLEAQATRLKLKRVEFCGATASPYEYYNTASILCLTSTFEGWGLVLTESQQAGVVPIAFACSEGVAEILSPSWENGVLIEPFDIDAYAAALARLMSEDELRKQIAVNCREAVKRYDLEHVGRSWEELIASLKK
jgi:glycosyltransferase involved in cell wall biosynthesis